MASGEWRLDEGQQFIIRGELAIGNQSVKQLAKFYGVTEREIRDVKRREGKYAAEPSPAQREPDAGLDDKVETE